MKVKKRPIVVDAVQWTGTNVDEILGFISTKGMARRENFTTDAGGIMVGGSIIIETLEGQMRADPLDWIIKGVKDEFYPCKNDIFGMTYEPA